MRSVVMALGALGLLAATAGIAEARNGCGPGWYYNGYRCVPAQAAPRYAPPVYAPPRYAPRAAGPRGYVFAGPDRWGKPTYYPRRGGQCPGGFTVQDGLCKPYRGY